MRPLAALALVLLAAAPALAQGAPPNAPATVELSADGALDVSYAGRPLAHLELLVHDEAGDHTLRSAGLTVLRAAERKEPGAPAPRILFAEAVTPGPKVTQTWTFGLRGDGPPRELLLRGQVFASEEAFACEARPGTHGAFPLVRTVSGQSDNLRNDSVYDRRFDWVLTGTPKTRVRPRAGLPAAGDGPFLLEVRGTRVGLELRPWLYRSHKGLTSFEPWKRPLRHDSIAGWCSWWPYRDAIDEPLIGRVASVLKERLRDYGYEYLQVDDGWQSGNGGLPRDWLATNARFPSGLDGLARTIRAAGLHPGLWLNVHVGDEAFAREHASWFVRDPDGRPHRGPWIDYAVDGSSKEALDAIVRPTYRALRAQGWEYVKVDTLRHLLYDAIYPARAHYDDRALTGEQAFRRLFGTAREELGDGPWLLACWGVLPEVAGIADACRLGTDGFGPASLQQFNSWNNVVWRNDPDHCDVTPEGEERIRPVLTSMAGAQLLLTDKVEVYQDDRKIEGARRSAPVLFSVPGQLYDHDPTKTDLIAAGAARNPTGAGPQPIDADQTGAICPHWLLEIDRPFERWSVLARLSWQPLPEERIAFADLGLEPACEYLVHEFWSGKLVGSFRGSFPARAQEARDPCVYAIREKLGRPQVVSTSRHMTQGGVDLVDVRWDETTLTLRGESRLVAGDPCTIALRAPATPRRFTAVSAEVAGAPAVATQEGEAVRLRVVPARTGSVTWSVTFRVE